jgi:hypothetical protein
MPFDVQGALKEGYTYKEILPELLKDNPDFDVPGARKEGYTDDEIGKFLSTGKGYDASPGGRVGAVPRGINTGLSTVLGAPVDAMNWALSKVGVPVSDKPFLGSESIKSGLDTVGGAASRAIGGEGKRLTYDRIEDLPPIERPFAIGGEAIGSSIVPAAAPLAMARAGIQGPAMLKPVMDMARNSPALFAAGEAGAAMGAAQGGALAEMLDPGDKNSRAIAEIAGSLINPVGTATRLGARAVEAGKNAITTRLSQAGREGRGADYLRKAFEQTGEDPSVALRMLQRPDEFGLKLTAGQRTNSPTLLAVEKKIGESSHRFLSQADTWGEEGLKALRQAADDLASSGDPRALAEAVKVRASYFDKVISGRINEAERRYRDATARMGSGDLAVSRQASSDAYNAVEGALGDARKIESDLWAAVPRDVPVGSTNTVAAYKNARGSLLPEENLGAPFESFIGKLAKAGGTDTRQLTLLRSRALEEGRRLRAAKDWAGARRMNTLAEGALDDLVTVQGKEADAARDFSRRLNERFSRSFAGDALGEKSTGAERINPELLLERAFGGGRNRGDVQMRELRDAAAFPEGSAFAEPMNNAQERFLRNAAARIVDPNTGAVNPQRLAGFMRDNQDILRQFPGYARDLTDLQTAQALVDQVRAFPQRASAVARKTSAFGSMLRGQEPAEVIGKALADPIQYQALINTAKKSGTGALDGLRTATLDTIMRRSTDADGAFSFARFRQNLTVAPRGRKPLIDTLQSQGVMSTGQADRLRSIINRADRLESALQSGSQINLVVNPPDAMTDFLTRVVGSKFGAMIPGQHTLIQQSAGSKLARNLFDKVPATRITDVLIQASEDPKLMQKLLERAPTPSQRGDIERQLNAAMIQAGLIPDDRESRNGP